MKMAECYVCLEETTSQSPCKCNLPLCETCYMKLLLYEYKQCKVCKEKFPIEEIVIDIVEPQPPESKCVYMPICCRKRSERRNPKYCCFDLTFHIVCVALMTLFFCSITNTCRVPDFLDSFIPAIISYCVTIVLLVGCTDRG